MLHAVLIEPPLPPPLLIVDMCFRVHLLSEMMQEYTSKTGAIRLIVATAYPSPSSLMWHVNACTHTNCRIARACICTLSVLVN